MDCLRIVGWKGKSESLPRQWIWEGEWALNRLTGAGSPGSGSSRFRLVECVHFWKGWGTGGQRQAGAWAAEPVPSTVVPQGRGEAGRRGARSFPQCFGISLCPLSVYPSSQSPFCPQDHYRKFCPTSVYVSSSEASRTSEKIILQPCCPGNFWSAASFVSFLKSLPIPSLCLLYQTPHAPSLPGSLHHSPSLQTLVQSPWYSSLSKAVWI